MGKFLKFIFGLLVLPIKIFFIFVKYIYKSFYNWYLRKYLEKLTLDKIDNLNGFDFEELVAILFKILGYKTIKTKKTRDYGADLIIKNRKCSIALQCKLYFGHGVGNSAVQEISTAKKYYNTDFAMIVTNSTFTKSATALASSAGVILLDRCLLERLLSKESNKQKLNIVNTLLVNLT